jgi:hypothetical protein
MKREMASDEKLMVVVREEGIDGRALVRSGSLEADGHI